MSVDDAKGMLAAAPEETAEAAAPAVPGALSSAMAASGAETAPVGSSAGGGGGAEDRVARITGAYQQATGAKPVERK